MLFNFISIKVRLCYVKNVFYVPFLLLHAHCLQHCVALTHGPNNSVVTVDVQLFDSKWELSQICAKTRTTFVDVIQTLTGLCFRGDLVASQQGHVACASNDLVKCLSCVAARDFHLFSLVG